jgi:calcineurin-like phosphoesterase family protein
MTKELLDSHFVEVANYLDVSVGGRHLVMCHYPLLCWGGTGKSWMIHGHIHNNRHMDYWPLLQVRERVLNAGVEINGYAPVRFDDLLENNIKQKELPQEQRPQEN